MKFPSEREGLVKRTFGARDIKLTADRGTQLISGVVYTVENECGIQADVRLEARWHPSWMKPCAQIVGHPIRVIDGEALQLTKLVHRTRDGESMKPCSFKDWCDLVKTMTEGAL